MSAIVSFSLCIWDINDPVLEFEFRIGVINVKAEFELIYANPWSSLK